MKLMVTVASNVADVLDRAFEVRDFRDVLSIGAVVARIVREWLRAVPLTPHTKNTHLHVSAEWFGNPQKDTAAAQRNAKLLEPPKRKTKRRK